jgi:hypothetical protein
MWCYWIEGGAWIIGAICAILAILNKVTREKGIGPKTVQTLTISLGVPLLLTLALEKLLVGETIAALVGALLGIGVQREKE